MISHQGEPSHRSLCQSKKDQGWLGVRAARSFNPVRRAVRKTGFGSYARCLRRDPLRTESFAVISAPCIQWLRTTWRHSRILPDAGLNKQDGTIVRAHPCVTLSLDTAQQSRGLDARETPVLGM